MSGSIGAASNYLQDSGQARRSAMRGPDDDGFGYWRLASTLALGPLPGAVPCARLHAKHMFSEWNLAHVAEDAELIVSELMTNALKATRPHKEAHSITLHLLANTEYLVIEVWDACSEAPAPRPHALDAETGRGLEIVSKLSGKWGFYHPAGGGKIVWAALVTGTAPVATREQAHDSGTAPPSVQTILCMCTSRARVCIHRRLHVHCAQPWSGQSATTIARYRPSRSAVFVHEPSTAPIPSRHARGVDVDMDNPSHQPWTSRCLVSRHARGPYARRRARGMRRPQTTARPRTVTGPRRTTR